MDITQRQRDILFAIIEEYAETATPVGSVTLAKLFDVSSATIRSEMNYLEGLGLLAQPHTSAGRVPTDSGYRFYVNTLAENARLSGHDEFEPLFKKSSEQSNGYLNPARLLEDKTMNRNTRILEIRVNSQMNADQAIRGAVDSLVDLTGNMGLATIGDQLYLAGISRLFNQPEFVDISRVQAVAKLLDNLEPWLHEAAPNEPLNIFIGQENPIGKTSGVSLIISKFRSPFSDSSYIGVLGPTRQSYGRVMSLVRHAGRMLEETL